MDTPPLTQEELADYRARIASGKDCRPTMELAHRMMVTLELMQARAESAEKAMHAEIDAKEAKPSASVEEARREFIAWINDGNWQRFGLACRVDVLISAVRAQAQADCLQRFRELEKRMGRMFPNRKCHEESTFIIGDLTRASGAETDGK
jgi:hypothetical protein